MKLNKYYVIALIFGALILAPRISLAAQVGDYITITSFSNTTSTITVTWDKATSTSHFPFNTAIYLATAAVNPIAPIYYSFHSGSQSWFLDGSSGGLTGDASTNGPCASGANFFSTDTSTGNSRTFTSIYDGVSNASIPVTSLTTGQTIQAVMVNYNAGAMTCSTFPANVTYLDTYTVGAMGGGLFQSISFQYPISATTTPPFTQWLVNTNFLNPADTYQVQVHWIPQITTNNSNPVFGDISNSFSSSTGGGVTILKPAAEAFGHFNTVTSTFQVNATAYLRDITLGRNVAQTSISFTQIPRLSTINGITIGTTTVVTPFLDSSSSLQIATGTDTTNYGNLNGSSTTMCASPTGGITDIGGGIAYGLCAAGQFLFTPSSNFTAGFQSGLTSFEGAFPFSLVFGIHNVLASSTNQFSNGSSTSAISIPLPSVLVPYIGSSTAPITLLNSSTVNNVVGGGANGNSFHTLIFTIESALMVVGTVVVLYLQVAG